MNKLNVAIAGAGIYGTTIAIELAKCGFQVSLYDPLGIMASASVINQFRIHRGYHYPRSHETIAEILESREQFIKEYKQAVVANTLNYYAIPHEGSLTSTQQFEKVCWSFHLPLKVTKPWWINFDFIQKCYLVDENIYDPFLLKSIIIKKLKDLKVRFVKKKFIPGYTTKYDFIVYATYGASGSYKYLENKMQIQVAEKMLIRLPKELHKKSLVVVDGPFTGFDAYGKTENSQFGSARYTNHWVTDNPNQSIPSKYKPFMNIQKFKKCPFTNFEKMLADSIKAVPLCKKAKYLGSRFTLRYVEYNPSMDRRILKIGQEGNKTFHVFSGKVVSAVKAAKIISEKLRYANN